MTLYRNHLSPPVFPSRWASAWGEDEYGLWQAFTYQDLTYRFRWIEPGTFMMGSPNGSGDQKNEEGRSDDEDLHQVTLTKGFWLGETTVTQELWLAVMELPEEQNPSLFKGEKLPVESVSWEDCKAFIEKLNQLHPEMEARLPWEAEWEYVCRAGTATPYSFGTRDDLSLEKVNYRGTWDDYEKWGEGAKQATAKVKSYPCNLWGLYEMHGNVWEWCEDIWQEHLGSDPVQDPFNSGYQDPDSQQAAKPRVLRGGSWDNFGGDVRSAIRDPFEPDDRYINTGFRLAHGH